MSVDFKEKQTTLLHLGLTPSPTPAQRDLSQDLAIAFSFVDDCLASETQEQESDSAGRLIQGMTIAIAFAGLAIWTQFKPQAAQVSTQTSPPAIEMSSVEPVAQESPVSPEAAGYEIVCNADTLMPFLGRVKP